MSQADELPPPPIAPDVDLRSYPYMPIYVRRLLTSDTWLLGSPEQIKAALCLWLEAWHQVPAGSLPSDEHLLAQLSQARQRWVRVREHALRGWFLASDRRLYHSTLNCLVEQAYAKLNVERHRTEKARAAAAEKRTANGLSQTLSQTGQTSVTGGKLREGKESKTTALSVLAVERARAPEVRGFENTESEKPKPATNPNWKVPSRDDRDGLDRFAKEHSIDPQQFATYADLQTYLIEMVKAEHAAKRAAATTPHMTKEEQLNWVRTHAQQTDGAKASSGE